MYFVSPPPARHSDKVMHVNSYDSNIPEFYFPTIRQRISYILHFPQEHSRKMGGDKFSVKCVKLRLKSKGRGSAGLASIVHPVIEFRNSFKLRYSIDYLSTYVFLGGGVCFKSSRSTIVAAQCKVINKPRL